MDFKLNTVTNNLTPMSTAAQDLKTEAKAQYWYDMFIKVTGYWYGNETPNMDKEEFIATRIRRAPRIEREKGEREDGFLKALDERIKNLESLLYKSDKVKGALPALKAVRDLYISTLTKK